jgi:hypothetical protein
VKLRIAAVHDEGLRRVFDIQIAPIGTEHLACCAADDHHVRPGLDPMLVCRSVCVLIWPDKNFTLW